MDSTSDRNELNGWMQTLETVRRRGQRVHMAFVDGRTGPVESSSAQVSILAMTGSGGVVVQAPDDAAASCYDDKGTVQVIAAGEHQRWRAWCALAGRVDHIDDESRTVAGFKLASPHALASGQRRTFYRVHIPEAHQPEAEVYAGPQADFALKGVVLLTRLVNLSAKGMGLVLDPRQLRPEDIKGVLNQRRVVCRLRMFDTENDIEVPAMVVHVRAARPCGVYIGLQIQHECESLQMRAEDCMLRLVTQIERQQLRRGPLAAT